MSVLALKVDIDTRQGMEEGLPKLLETLGRKGLKASFFLSMGPDRSGLAVLQLLRPRFAYKMLRANAVSTYGIKTALYGTLLKAPMIGCAFPERIREITASGHEGACHAWDHRLWQDWLPFMRTGSVKRWLDSMVESFVSITGEKPLAFGAPGWNIDTRVLHLVKNYGFSYLSCTRAREPFIFEENGLLELPSNLPCIEEAGTRGVIDALDRNADSKIPQVLPVHTEVEGGRFGNDFEVILDKAASLGYTVRRLCDIVHDIDRTSLPTRGLTMGHLPNRAFKCAV
ncbi:MAG: polysaccharide deacetylase family protein [Desulfomonilia bacterium]|jgi:peptidoglycan/xylan/chitin deacetylase (PgdA/CDA1 family)|nr:polysaccharide deacetylase family protein [Desulfomonilia bacterium]